MATEQEYAQLSLYVYNVIGTLDNRPGLPSSDWEELEYHPDGSDGFSYGVFRNNATGEIVIAYAGTNPNSLLDPDNAANIGLATGYGSVQLLQAAKYYLQVKAANPNATITFTFTGHSLGGGLAALIGVFFGVQAVTFDQAPFAESAELNLLTPDVAANLRSDLAAVLDANGNRLYDDAVLCGLSNFLQLRQTNGGIPNSNLVSTIRVDGEFTSSLPVGSLTGGTAADLLVGNAGNDWIFCATTIDWARWQAFSSVINSCKAANDESIQDWRAAA